MTSVPFLITLLVAFASSFPQDLPGGVSPATIAGKVKPDFVCTNGIFGPTPETAAAIGKCKEEVTNSKCEFFCVGKYLGLLESSGLPTRESYARFTRFNFPESLHEKSLKHFNECLNNFKVDLEDKECEKVTLFNDCTWKLQPELTC